MKIYTMPAYTGLIYSFVRSTTRDSEDVFFYLFDICYCRSSLYPNAGRRRVSRLVVLSLQVLYNFTGPCRSLGYILSFNNENTRC